MKLKDEYLNINNDLKLNFYNEVTFVAIKMVCMILKVMFFLHQILFLIFLK